MRLIEYVSISAGMAIAASSFMIVSELYRVSNAATAPTAIVLSAVICIFACLAVAKLARIYPSSPGIRTYLKAVYGNGFSLFMTYFMILGIALFAGVECNIIGRLLGDYYGLNARLVSILIIPAICAINLAGYEMPRKLQICLTAFMILFIGGYSISAILSAPEHAAVPPPAAPVNPLEGLLSGIGIAAFLYMGFEWVTSTGRNIHDYRRLIPVSMIIAIITVSLFYLALAFALHARLPVEQFAGVSSPHVVLAASLHGHSGAAAMVAISLFATVSTLNAGLIGVSRLIYSLGRQKVLPSACARISSSGAPIGGIVTMSLVALAALFAEFILELFDVGLFVTAFGYCVLYAAYLLAAGRIGRIVNDAAAEKRTGSALLVVPAGFFLLVGFSVFFADDALVVKSIATAATIGILAVLGTLYSLRRGAAEAATAPAAVRTD